MESKPRFFPLLLFLLSIVSGFIEAYVFIHTKVFTASMTGNSILFPVYLMDANFPRTTMAVIAFFGFVFGVTCGALLLYKIQPDTSWNKTTNKILFIETAIFVLLSILLIINPDLNKIYIVIGSAFAMGLQIAAISQLGIPGVTTVVVTGTITMAISKLIYRGRKVIEGHHANHFTPTLQSISWIAYLVGAGIASIQARLLNVFPFTIPVLLLLVVFLLFKMGNKKVF
jgi:uncharacterized membrane protein YoaK (UPF0700 family)